jgi:two-component system chemotaxis response regulator CheY
MRRVLSIGQCGYDHGSIARQFRGDLGAEVVAASTFREALSALRGSRFDLVLVNRVTDADGSLGLELIRTLKADPALADLPVMLVSNYTDAQKDAESLGALPGFGKSDIGSMEVKARLREVLAVPSASPTPDA